MNDKLDNQAGFKLFKKHGDYLYKNDIIAEVFCSDTKKIDFGSELDAAKAEAKAWKTIWSAGQGVTSIKDVIPVSNLVSELKKDFLLGLERMKEAYNIYN